MKTYPFYIDKAHAIIKLVGGRIAQDGDTILYKDGQTPPTEEAIEVKLGELQTEYDAQEYVRNRQLDYPSTGDQLDMMYKDTKNSTTTHADAVEAVKTKWPKNNTGPVE